MGLFNKFHHSPERAEQSAPGFSSSETTNSQNEGDSPRLLSSGTSIMSQSTTNSGQSSYLSRKAEKGWVRDINKHNLMAKHLYRNCKKNNWIEDKSNEVVVALRTFQGEHILFPPEIDEKFERAIKGLNVEVSNIIDKTDSRHVFESIPMSSKSL
jgi:hypothetical protein